MKRGFRGLAGKKGTNALGILVLALLLFPSSSSVLCIAPGNHVAIEDINALCCAASAFSVPRSNQPNLGWDGQDSCNNCTDLFLAWDGNGALPQSGKFVTSAQVDAECPDTCLPADNSASVFPSRATGSTDSPIPASNSVPLRC